MLNDLTPSRLKLLQEIAERIWDAPSERERILQETCAGDPTLRAQVEALLEADRDTGPLSDSVADDAFAAIAEQEARRHDMIGRQIGRYRIVRKLGEGGMGVVYLGERADGAFEQQVAVKLMRSTVGSDLERSRFRQEQRVLASLDHPAIARLYDAGQTDDGRAFFIMECVEGERITHYCRRHRLSVNDRVRLVLEVARALQYAHGKLIIHRDVKPSNVLVDGRGRVKLLDFGIAKLLDDEARSDLTRSGDRPMTLDYAAPEQIRTSEVSIQTDVYQLGVVLYELLAGERPFQRGRDDYERIREIMEGTPPRPSQAQRQFQAARDAVLRELSTPAAPPGEAAARDAANPPTVPAGDGTPPGRPPAAGKPPPRRGPSRRRDRATIPADLDAIVLRAMARDLGERYRSMEAFAGDLEAFLEGRPVEARTPSVTYRYRKFLMRHPFANLAVVGFVLLLTAWTTTATFQAERLRAETAKARETALFLENVFRSWDPRSGPGERVLVRDLLDDARRRIDAELETPEVRARLLVVLAGLYNALGLYQQQVQIAQEALAIRQEFLTPPHPALLEVIEMLGDGLRHTGQYQAALATADEALSQALALDSDAVSIGAIEHDAAMVLARTGDLEAARERFEAALARMRRAGATDVPEYAAALVDFGSLVLFPTGEWERALAANGEAIEIMQRHHGRRHQEVAILLNNRGTLLSARGDLEAAERLHREALDIQLERLAPDHEYVAATRIDLAKVLADRQDFYGASEQLRQAIEVRTQVFGETHLRTNDARFVLGGVELAMGDLDAAYATFRDTTAVYRELFGAGHPRVGMSLSRLASVTYRRGDLTRATALYREALDCLPPGMTFRSTALYGYGLVLRDRGEVSAAREHLEAALQIRQAVLAPGDPLVREVEEALASLPQETADAT